MRTDTNVANRPCTARRRAVEKSRALIYRCSYCGAGLAQDLHSSFIEGG